MFYQIKSFDFTDLCINFFLLLQHSKLKTILKIPDMISEMLKKK